jgi:DNA-directed RNA polymerase specialized sigma subunit
MTLADIAKRFGVTKQTASRIERRALAKLRREIENRASVAGVSPATWLGIT